MTTPTVTRRDRPTYVVAQIRARDLADGDVLRHRLAWREVLDVWTDEDRDTALGQYDGDQERMRLIEKHLTELGRYVIARILIEEPDTHMVNDDLVVFRSCDLVDIQVPGPLTAPYRQFSIADQMRPGVTIDREALDEYAGRELTDQEVTRIQACVPHSSIPEAIGVIASQFAPPSYNDDNDDNDECGRRQ